MILQNKIRSARLAIATATAMTASLIAVTAAISPAYAQTTQRPANDLALSQGRGQLINLPAAISDVMVSNEAVADVQVRSPRQIYVFAKTSGESTVFAMSKDGKVVYSTNVRVGTNINSLDHMLSLAMPEAQIKTTTMNGLVLLTGTVATPEDSAEAERLVEAFLGANTKVVSRLKSATPLQVSLHVKIAEVSRDFTKKVGFNLLAGSGGFLFGQGRSDALTFELNPLTPSNPNDIRAVIKPVTGGSTLAYAGRFLGLDLEAALDLAENDGLVTTLAEPNLTAISGETASFLAGGEIPIPIAQGSSNTISVEYKQYGVSLAFTPTVLADGRISMRVRPEVSQLTSAGSVTLGGFTIPALSTRRTETTVEMGSGQSFMIGGLLQSSQNNSTDKAPFLGDLPILGALFKSNNFRRNETELVIIVTPYLVRPVSANQIALPTDGYRAPTDAQRLLLGQTFDGKSGEERAKPRMGDPVVVPAPSVGAALPADGGGKRSRKDKQTAAAAPTPGFGN